MKSLIVIWRMVPETRAFSSRKKNGMLFRRTAQKLDALYKKFSAGLLLPKNFGNTLRKLAMKKPMPLKLWQSPLWAMMNAASMIRLKTYRDF